MKKIGSIIWLIIHNVIVVIVSLLIFDNIYGTFETIIIAVLILTYLSVMIYGKAIIVSIIEKTIYFARESLKIKELLNSPELEEGKEELAKAEEQLKTITIKNWINHFFGTVIWLIVLYNLFGELI